MSSILNRLFLLLVLVLGAAPLRAQLDPRLQGSTTDFLNLYQQSTSLKAKPEIVSIFDFSGSMTSLMYHPLFRNDDKLDRDDYRYMKFFLTDAVVGSGPNNTYTLTAKADKCSTATAYYQVTVASNGSVTVLQQNPTPLGCSSGTTNASSYAFTAKANGNTNATTTLNITPVSATTAGTNYQLGTSSNAGAKSNASGTYTMVNAAGSSTAPTIAVTQVVNPDLSSGPVGGPFIPGAVLTLEVYMKHPWLESEPVSNKYITWSGAASGGGTWSEITANTLYKSVVTWTVPNFTPTAAAATQLAPITASSGTLTAGSTYTFTTSFTRNDSASTKVTWTASSGSGYACATTPTPTSTATSGTIGVANKATWKIPAYCGTSSPSTPAYVTVTLDASAGGNYSVTGLTYPGSLTATTSAADPQQALRKPDGTAVTEADAIAASTSSGLYGASGGKLDVRNWIRAASHVRFKSGTRTIDLPIPWKIMNRSSSSNPLTSVTFLDQLVKTSIASDGTATTTTYGSGLPIEPDLTYRLNTGSNLVFTADNGGTNLADSTATSGQKTAWLYTIAYRPSYIAWLFNGKFQSTDTTKPNYTTDSSIAGKYVVFDAATSNLAGSQGTNLAWGQGFGPALSTWGSIQVPQYKLDGTPNGTSSLDASGYRIPSVSRVQATKQAAIQTWINHQHEVYWAFRTLDVSNESNGGTATSIDNSSTTTLSASDPTTTRVVGSDSGWTVLNNTSAQGINSTTGNSVTGMKRIAALFAANSTPLTYAMARTLAQYNDPSSVFNAVVGSNVSQCVNHYLLLFTDGVDNNGTGSSNGNAATPYITTNANGAQILNALAGNQGVIGSKTSIDRNGSWWNLFTFAGIGAHLSDPTFGNVNADYMAQADMGTGTTSGSPSSFLPMAIKKRNGVAYEKDHRITTMTVGVSLGGQYTDTASPKRSLFLAAVVGDPLTKSGLLSDFHSFNGWDQATLPVDPSNDWIPDPQDPSSYPSVGKRRDGAVYFFDATDVDKLSRSMDYAFKIAVGTSSNNSTASPNLPFTGASVGKQTYIGTFQPPKIGGAIWPGDLLMFGTRENAATGVVQIIDKSGNVASSIDSSTAQWSASAALNDRVWTGRKLLTRLPGNATVAERGLHAFSDTGTAFTNANTTDNTAGLQYYVAQNATNAQPVGGSAQIFTVRNAMGANPSGPVDGSGRPTANRLNIMGDIIDSSPAALEYTITDATVQAAIASSPKLSAVGATRFRLILVGTNQGWVHGFGEATKVSTVTDLSGTSQEIVTGAVDELWAFMPTDFLAYLNDAYGQYAAGNSHRFMADGTPTIYHLDLPAAGGGTGNGKLDYSGNERAVAVFGLRRGGRSYYALDIKDPLNPSLRWSLVPDEAAYLPATRNLTGLGLSTLQSIVGRFGFSTCTPGLGRVQFTNSGTTKLRDVVFLGGGDSNQKIESNFLDAAGKTIPLGRTVAAVDVYTGEILSAVDLTSIPGVSTTLGPPVTPSTCSVGPVSAGVIPFEFILNSGMAQRAYFMDYKGGLWSWGSKATADSSLIGYTDYRVDTSDLAKWTTTGAVGGSAGIRKVFQDPTGLNAMYTTLPAPFRVGTFPGKPKNTGSPAPAAAGIAMVSGNRNNPLDYLYPTGTAPTQHRVTVVYDRQDSRAWSLDSQSGPDTGIGASNLKNFSPNTVGANTSTPCTTAIWKEITPGCDDYYLAPATGTPFFGYYINFPASNGTFVPKGINVPMVVAGSLFYSYFTPTTADPCTGGTGLTYSNLVADVINPIVQDNRSGITNPSGSASQVSWSGVASDFIAYGTRGVLQGGTVPVANPVPGGVQTTLEMKTMTGNPKERFPKPRVWRTVR